MEIIIFLDNMCQKLNLKCNIKQIRTYLSVIQDILFKKMIYCKIKTINDTIIN